MKLFSICLILAFFYISLAANYVPPVFPPNDPSPFPINPWEVQADVDNYIRTKYWYYLVDANICYRSYSNSAKGFLFIHVYKNYIGTFQVLSSYYIRSNKITVNTFVRLGDGYLYQPDSCQPIHVDPYVVSVDLGNGQSSMAHGSNGNNQNYSWERKTNYGWDSDETHTYCQIAKEQLEITYSYYLVGARTIDVRQVKASGRYYCVYHLVNNIGTWLAVLSIDFFERQVEINTFVRTGDGYDPRNSPAKCYIRPAPIQDRWSFQSN